MAAPDKKKTVTKGPSKRKPSQLWKAFSASGGKLERKNKSCPKCGAGVFMAKHKNRNTCGKCGFMEKH